MFCRICEEEFNYPNSKMHVEAHKRKYCKLNGIPVENWWRVNWEIVVRFFNPDNAREKPIEEIILNQQLNLDKF